jgi:hypothetical protein
VTKVLCAHSAAPVRSQWCSYEGSFRAGLFHDPVGVWTSGEGHAFHGEHVESTWQGFGTYRWPSGEVHHGHWREDRPCGPGVRILPDGTRYEVECTWEADADEAFLQTPGARQFLPEYHQVVVHHGPSDEVVKERWFEGKGVRLPDSAATEQVAKPGEQA